MEGLYMNEKAADNREQVAIKYISDTLSKELVANSYTLRSILKIAAEFGDAFNQIRALSADFDYIDHGLKFFALCFCEKPMHIKNHLAAVINNLLFGDNAENAIQNTIDDTFCWSAHLIHDYKFDEEKYKEMLKEIDALKGLIEIKMKWIPVAERLPDGSANEIFCLVTCREWNVIVGQWGRDSVRILSYFPKEKMWNTKAMIEVNAWMPLPDPYVE